MILYRTVGLQQLALIYDSGMKAFPARLPQQPIFYPVLELAYARQIASDWNAKSGQAAGYVTRFKVEDQYINQFEKHTVGSSQHQEFWIPAEGLEEFNKQIVGHIKVIEAHFGDAFEGFIPEQFGLQGKNAVEQFTLLANSYLYKRMEFYLEIKRNHKAVFLNFPFWHKYEFKNPGLKEKILQAIKDAWLTSFPQIPLPLPPPDLEDIPPVEETDADADSLVDPVQEEATPVEQTGAHAPSSVNPAYEDISPVRQTHALSSVNAVRKDSKPVEQPYSNSLIHPIHEDITPVEEPSSDSLLNPVDEEPTPAEQTDANVHIFVDPVPEEITLPTQTNLHFEQGIKLGLNGRYHEAIAALSQAVEENPDQVAAQTSLGVAFHRLGEDDRALACYEAALKIDPASAEAHYFRANILYTSGNVREAIAGYTRAIGLEPELIEAHQGPAPQDRLIDYSPAPAEMVWIAKPAHRILHLNRSLETDPRQTYMQAFIFKERATQYYRLWNYEQAAADYSSSLALQPEDASALHSRGLAYEQMGQYDRALEDFQQAIRIDPQLSDVYIHRGVTFGRMGNLRQSIASLSQGLRLAPENPDGYFNRGTAYFQLGDFERAIEDFSNVIRLAPGDEAAYYWRGISNEETGRQREAMADYTQFLAVSQDENAREEIEQRLGQWNEGKRNGPGTVRHYSPRSVAEREDRRVSSGSVIPDDGPKTDPVPAPSGKPGQEFDLYGLMAALGERAFHSLWFGSGVECYGEKAEELYAFAAQDRPIEGRDLLQIASGIQQTIRGDFHAFDPGGTSHWLFLRAWEGNGFYIETNDPDSMKRLRTHFPSIEDVDGATPPYEGFFIRI